MLSEEQVQRVRYDIVTGATKTQWNAANTLLDDRAVLLTRLERAEAVEEAGRLYLRAIILERYAHETNDRERELGVALAAYREAGDA